MQRRAAKQLIGGNVFPAVQPTCVELYFAFKSIGDVTEVTKRAGGESGLQIGCRLLAILHAIDKISQVSALKI